MYPSAKLSTPPKTFQMVDRPLKWLNRGQGIEATDHQKSCSGYSPKLLLSWVESCQHDFYK